MRASEARGLEMKGWGHCSSPASYALSRGYVWTEGVGLKRKTVGKASTYWAQGRRYGFWAPWTAYSLGPSCIPGGGGGSWETKSLPNQIILFQLLKSFSFVCNGKVIIFRFGFLLS